MKGNVRAAVEDVTPIRSVAEADSRREEEIT